VAGIHSLLDDLDGDTRNVVLTFARIWTTLATGEIRSKAAAADWALAQLSPEHCPVLNMPGSCTSTAGTPRRWSDELSAQLHPHVDEVLAEIDRLPHR